MLLDPLVDFGTKAQATAQIGWKYSGHLVMDWDGMDWQGRIGCSKACHPNHTASRHILQLGQETPHNVSMRPGRPSEAMECAWQPETLFMSAGSIPSLHKRAKIRRRGMACPGRIAPTPAPSSRARQAVRKAGERSP